MSEPAAIQTCSIFLPPFKGSALQEVPRSDQKRVDNLILKIYHLDRLDTIKYKERIIMKNTWQLQEAKNKFSNLVDKAQHNGPQIVTKRGKEAVVVISFDDYKTLTKPETNLFMFLQNSPLVDIGLKIKRDKKFPRDVEI